MLKITEPTEPTLSCGEDNHTFDGRSCKCCPASIAQCDHDIGPDADGFCQGCGDPM